MVLPNYLKEVLFVYERKLKFGGEWRHGDLCRGWYSANIIMCQYVKKFECAYPDYEREYAVFQRDGWICI